MLRWAAYTIIFFVAAFVLHFVVESIVTLVIGVVAPNAAKSAAGPFILVADFVLAGPGHMADPSLGPLVHEERGGPAQGRGVPGGGAAADRRRRTAACRRTSPAATHGRGRQVAPGTRPARVRQRGAGGARRRRRHHRAMGARFAASWSGRWTTRTLSIRCAIGSNRRARAEVGPSGRALAGRRAVSVSSSPRDGGARVGQNATHAGRSPGTVFGGLPAQCARTASARPGAGGERLPRGRSPCLLDRASRRPQTGRDRDNVDAGWSCRSPVSPPGRCPPRVLRPCLPSTASRRAWTTAVDQVVGKVLQTLGFEQRLFALGRGDELTNESASPRRQLARPRRPSNGDRRSASAATPAASRRCSAPSPRATTS